MITSSLHLPAAPGFGLALSLTVALVLGLPGQRAYAGDGQGPRSNPTSSPSPAVSHAASPNPRIAGAIAEGGATDDRVVPWLRRKLDPTVPDEGPPAPITPLAPASSPDGRTVPWPREQRAYQMPYGGQTPPPKPKTP